MIPERRVIFICTGNYYRSRYAELYFNARVPASSRCHAVSRGLRLSAQNIGPIAPWVLERLHSHQISLPDQIPSPRQLQIQELTESDFLIALNEIEHRPYVEHDLPAWRTRVAYWHVPDVNDMPIEQALRIIEVEVNALLLQFLSLPNE